MKIAQVVLAIAIAYFSSVEAVDRELNAFTLLPDGPFLDPIGYDNIEMSSNGELSMMGAIEPGDLVFDIGANVGDWTARLLSIEPSALVYCFEPVPDIFAALQENLKEEPAILNRVAISSSPGRATFFYYADCGALSTLHRRPKVESYLNTAPTLCEVELEALDTFCQARGIQHIDFVKIDTEGNELNVLMGAKGLLESGAIDMIQFEYCSCYLDSKTTLKEVYAYLSQYGYRIYRITFFGLIEIAQWRDDLETFKYSNYLAVRIE